MKKRILAISVLLSLSMAVPAFAGIGVSIDGESVPFTTSSGYPVKDENGRTLVPLRATMEAFGCSVSWDESTQKAYVFDDNSLVTVPIGIPLIDVDGTPVAIDTEAKLIDGRVYLPIRAVLESFGASVKWHKKAQTISVLSPSQPKSVSKKEVEENQYLRDKTDETYRQLEAEMERIRKELEESNKQAEKARKEAEKQAEINRKNAIYDSISNSGGYSNSYAISQGYNANLLSGGYGSTYADIAAQQYRDNLLASGKR